MRGKHNCEVERTCGSPGELQRSTRREEAVWYLQVLPPHVDGSEGQLHLFPAGVLVSLVRNLDENEEDPGNDAASDQHEDT